MCVCVFVPPPPTSCCVSSPPLFLLLFSSSLPLFLFVSFRVVVVTVFCVPPAENKSAWNDVMHRREGGCREGGVASALGRVGADHHAGWGLAVAVASVAVALVGVLGALLGCCGVSHGALGLRGALDAALVAQALARVLEDGQQHRVHYSQSFCFLNVLLCDLMLRQQTHADSWESNLQPSKHCAAMWARSLVKFAKMKKKEKKTRPGLTFTHFRLQ